jgi:hypothetical protein
MEKQFTMFKLLQWGIDNNIEITVKDTDLYYGFSYTIDMNYKNIRFYDKITNKHIIFQYRGEYINDELNYLLTRLPTIFADLRMIPVRDINL